MDLADALTALMFGALAFMALVVALRADTGRDREDAVMLALILIAAWALSNIAWLFFNPLRTNSIIDVATLGYCLFRFKPLDGWRMGFTVTVALQIAIDLYRELATTDFTVWATVLNGTFGLQVVIVTLGALPDGRNYLLALPRSRRRAR